MTAHALIDLMVLTHAQVNLAASVAFMSSIGVLAATIYGAGTRRIDLADTTIKPSQTIGIPMTKPSITLPEAQAIVATKTAPKVTLESIEAKIENVGYVLYQGNLTICVITMFNGFMVHGVSAAASAANFDADVGKRYAYDNAFKQLWPLEGYLLREKLSIGPA